jgi:hypothetical protein
MNDMMAGADCEYIGLRSGMGSIFEIVLGGLVVSVLAIGPKFRGFKPGQGRRICKCDKINRKTPSFGEKAKPSAPSCKISRHVTQPFEISKS